jgi:hypothetical protein
VRISTIEEGKVAVKRLGGVFVAALMLVALTAAPASASFSLLDRYLLDIEENRSRVKVDGPGFKVRLTKDALTAIVDDARFGFPQSGAAIVRGAPIGPPPAARAYTCENGTYRATPDGRGIFNQVSRASSLTLERPVPPYSTTFNRQFVDPFTFVGTLTATVVNEQGETFRLMMSDLANEVFVFDRFFVSTNPIHAFFVDAQGKIRDRASLVGRVIVDTKTGHMVHYVIDRGTCHQTAPLPAYGATAAPVFGPFFVLPFDTTIVGG